MKDLLRTLTARAQRAAEPYARVAGAANRTYQIGIIRPDPEPTFTRSTGQMTSSVQTVVYTGPARMQPVTPTASLDIGDGPAYLDQAVFTIGVDPDEMPRVDDIISVLAVPPANETWAALGRQFRIEGVGGGGGFLNAGISLIGTGVAASRWTFPPETEDQAVIDAWARAFLAAERGDGTVFDGDIFSQ